MLYYFIFVVRMLLKPKDIHGILLKVSTLPVPLASLFRRSPFPTPTTSPCGAKLMER